MMIIMIMIMIITMIITGYLYGGVVATGPSGCHLRTRLLLFPAKGNYL